ncbi:hypothetical protein Rxycam_01978 [Rubrobacter xylanophilus DSM 9941]|uniref:hypothetical protein n=1 Tax=Rubrobacter xylanophilus TaxID=49319 RepID=UPI001C63D2CA|nr:hypothetical protein [Rubrobacter xylanophilus]QYJ16147.1 hypothetical protein Rxycam_01978 [Rubrobacter xylanophilus DSM 9941]
MDRSRKIAVGMGLYFFVCTMAMIWPGAAFANRIEPFVLGLPFFFFWYVFWVFLVFVGCVLLYRLEYRGR